MQSNQECYLQKAVFSQPWVHLHARVAIEYSYTTQFRIQLLTVAQKKVEHEVRYYRTLVQKQLNSFYPLLTYCPVCRSAPAFYPRHGYIRTVTVPKLQTANVVTWVKCTHCQVCQLYTLPLFPDNAKHTFCVRLGRFSPSFCQISSSAGVRVSAPRGQNVLNVIWTVRGQGPNNKH